MKLAIIIGVSDYAHDDFDNLNACKNDAELFLNVISNVKKIDDVLYANDSPTGYVAKKQLSDFVSKHKKNPIDELIFYFSGHGGRYEDDFFYILSDFRESKKESTGLRNTELDGLVRALKPKLFIKIVDACFSGTQYIKSESNARADLIKSAKENQLNNTYFMFSSRDNQPSLAGSEFSKFTESLFSSLLEHTGEIRYRDVTAFIADDFNSNSFPKPIFISQADLVESFGVITENTHQIIIKAFGLLQKPKDTIEIENGVSKESDNTLLDLVLKKAEHDFCDEQTVANRLLTIKNGLAQDKWPDDLISIYDISVAKNNTAETIPNAHRIGIWLNENDSKEYFAKATYAEDVYEVEEYRPLPKKPVSKNSIASIVSFSKVLTGVDDTEYKLEKVKKTRSVFSGFKHSCQNENNIIIINFEPKHISVKPAIIFLVSVYSKTELAIHYSYEFVKFTNWKTRASPSGETWKSKIVRMKNENNVLNAKNEILNEISGWAVSEIKKSLGNK